MEELVASESLVVIPSLSYSRSLDSAWLKDGELVTKQGKQILPVSYCQSIFIDDSLFFLNIEALYCSFHLQNKQRQE